MSVLLFGFHVNSSIINIDAANIQFRHAEYSGVLFNIWLNPTLKVNSIYYQHSARVSNAIKNTFFWQNNTLLIVVTKYRQ